MTPAQLTTLNALATADQTALGYIDTADDQSLADWLNTVDASFYVYRSVLTPAMARSAIIQGATQLDGLTVGKRDSLFYLASGDLARATSSLTPLRPCRSLVRDAACERRGPR